MPLLTVKESNATVIEPSREPLFKPAHEPLFDPAHEPLFEPAHELWLAQTQLVNKSSFKFRLKLGSFILTNEPERTFIEPSTEPSPNDSAHWRP